MKWIMLQYCLCELTSFSKIKKIIWIIFNLAYLLFSNKKREYKNIWDDK